jgi:transcriptional regulator with XRE-family HTH domain
MMAAVEEPEVQRARAFDGFAANVLAFRRIAGLSQRQAALRAGLHRTEISLLERAGRMPRLDTVVRVAAGVEAEPADLLEGLAWEIGTAQLHSELPLPERADRIVEGRRTVWVAGRWTRVGRG